MRRVIPAAAFFLAAPLIVQAGGITAASAASAAPAHPAVSNAPAIEKVQAAPELPRGAASLGPLSASASVSGMVVLKPPNNAALQAFIKEVTNRQSAEYHQYLAPGQFASRFGASQATINTVKNQLQTEGLQVTGVSPDGLFIAFTGTASRTQSAFHTSINRYRLSDGSIGQGTTSAVQLPSSIAGSVSSVIGLNNLVKLQPADIRRGSAASGTGAGTHPAAKAPAFTHPAGSATPCTDATSAAQALGGLTDDQIANAYGAFGQYNLNNFGTGQHIAVYELEPFDPADLQAFDTCYFGATKAAQMAGTNGNAGGRLSITPVDGGQTAGPGSGESILDIEDVSAIAPNANIDVFEAPNNTFGGIDEYQQMIDTGTPDPIITSSWGLCETAIQEGEPGVQQAENILFEQAAAQGQSVFSAAGDTGSNTCNAFRTPAPVSPILSVNDPSSQPYVVAVGGTTINDATTPPQETVWNDGPSWGAGGGGISGSWAMPSWQVAAANTTSDHAAVTAANTFEATDLGQPGYEFCLSAQEQTAGTTACRQLPDVSAQADEFTGAVTVFSAAFGGWTTIGGTSSATPIWAALLALVNTSATCKTNGLTSPAGVGGVGFVSPLLYSVASSPQGAVSFNDIATGNNDPYSDSGLFPATPGYDMAVGLGTPVLTTASGGPALAVNLCNVARPSVRPAVASFSPAFGPTTGGTVTITGSNFTNVTGVQVGGFNLPTADFHVNSATSITATLPAASVLIPVTAPPTATTPPITVPAESTDGAGGYQVLLTSTTSGVTATSAATPTSVFEYVDENGAAAKEPTVSSVRTYGGPEAGGNTVDIFGAGFTGVTGPAGVTFGGVDATSYTVLNDFHIRATVPAFGGGTTCTQDGSSFGETATTDICQSRVVVTSPGGSSTTTDTDSILPLYEGAFALNANGVQPAPAGQEAAPQPDEYDYYPGPTITSISTDTGPADYASELGLTVITIHGTGFNLAGLDWVNIGDPTAASSQNFFNIVNITGTAIELVAPPEFGPDGDLTSTPLEIPASVRTIAGLSPAGRVVTYAGVPTVTGVVSTGPPTTGQAAAPDTGGTPIQITGSGFSQAIPTGQSGVGLAISPIELEDVNPFGFTSGSQYNYTLVNDGTIDTTTVAVNPGIVDVTVCSVTACSIPTSAGFVPGDDELALFPPGNPVVDAVSPASEPADALAPLTINGQNLGCVTSVSFGGVAAAPGFTNTPALLDCGLTTQIIGVDPPPLPAGTHLPHTVTVLVDTIESTSTGAPAAHGTFTYEGVAPAFTADSPPSTGSVGHAYGPYTFRASGAPAPTFSVSSGALPPGLKLNGTSGVLSGTPTTAGGFSFRVTASDGINPAAVSPVRTITVSAATDTGYRAYTSTGQVFSFGSDRNLGSINVKLAKPIVGAAVTPNSAGFWMVASDGGLFAFGNAGFHGSLGAVKLAKPIVAMAATPDGGGYWMVASDGGVFAFGDAGFHGSLGNVHLTKPIVGMASTANGGGYWLVASDGGLFAFGNAAFHGSLGKVHLAKPINAMAPTHDGGGYWLVASDGGLFAFGDATFHGSLGGTNPASPVMSILPTPDDNGYGLVQANGTVRPFGDFHSFGSAATRAPVVAFSS